MIDIKKEVSDVLVQAVGIKEEEVVLETPPDPKLGDLAFPCFSLAKQRKKNPVAIAQELAQGIPKQGIIS